MSRKGLWKPSFDKTRIGPFGLKIQVPLQVFCCIGLVGVLHHASQPTPHSFTTDLGVQKFSDEIMARVAEADGRGLIKEGNDRQVSRTI